MTAKARGWRKLGDFGKEKGTLVVGTVLEYCCIPETTLQ